MTVLLRNPILRERRLCSRWLYNPSHHERGQCRLDSARSLPRGEDGSSWSASYGSYWHVRGTVHCRHHWHCSSGGQHCGSTSSYCVRVHLHLLLRIKLGTCGLGGDRRAVPAQGASKVLVYDYCDELVSSCLTWHNIVYMLTLIGFSTSQSHTQHPTWSTKNTPTSSPESSSSGEASASSALPLSGS